jgi:hypothetical protein
MQLSLDDVDLESGGIFIILKTLLNKLVRRFSYYLAIYSPPGIFSFDVKRPYPSAAKPEAHEFAGNAPSLVRIGRRRPLVPLETIANTGS